MSSDRPLLLVDVDGVLSLFGFDAGAPPQGHMALIDGSPHLLSSNTAWHLGRLGAVFECVWCTGWEEKADEYLPHLLGLPRGIPHVTLERNPGRERAHWKIEAIDEYAGNRPAAWIDDNIDETCTAWAEGRDAPTLLIETSPSQGLTDEHVSRLIRWADELEGWIR
jgi:hypothetical protein